MHLEERGFGVDSAATGAEGFRMAEQSPPSAIVLDMRLPDASGIDLIPELKKRAAEAPVLMITAHHDMATTILAMKAGAFDYIHKPIDIQAFDLALDRALEVRRLSKGSDYLSVEQNRAFKMDDIVGTSPSMQQLFKDVGRVAASRATVLIHGESGTGKELIARAIHQLLRGEQALRRRQLRGHRRHAARERAVRPREGRLHRRPFGRSSASSSWPTDGTHLPRRDRRAAAEPPGQAAARAPGTRGGAGRRRAGASRSRRASSPPPTATSPRR